MNELCRLCEHSSANKLFVEKTSNIKEENILFIKQIDHKLAIEKKTLEIKKQRSMFNHQPLLYTSLAISL